MGDASSPLLSCVLRVGTDGGPDIAADMKHDTTGMRQDPLYITGCVTRLICKKTILIAIFQKDKMNPVIHESNEPIDGNIVVVAAPPPPPEYAVPELSLWEVFLLFFGFGLRAWGGPVAQIAGIKERLVLQDKWIPVAKFNQVLAVYQAFLGQRPPSSAATSAISLTAESAPSSEASASSYPVSF